VSPIPASTAENVRAMTTITIADADLGSTVSAANTTAANASFLVPKSSRDAKRKAATTSGVVLEKFCQNTCDQGGCKSQNISSSVLERT